jgi:hypothetical protein
MPTAEEKLHMRIPPNIARRPIALAALVSALACGGAGPSSDVLVASTDNLDTTNGISLNGISLNGISLNGISLNGISLNGISLNGISLNGVTLSGSTLVAVSSKTGKTLSGSQLAGASLSGLLSNGTSLQMRIDSVWSGAAPNADVTFYNVSYNAAGSWKALCGYESPGVPAGAVALAGTWDYSQGTPTGGAWTSSSSSFTFGCRHTALAKCVELGYKPWVTFNGHALRQYHQACTRLIRADYCGNGRPWTLNGRLINLYDGIGLQADTESWLFEAEWTDKGASCLTTMRVIDLQNVFGVVDQCILAKVSLFCGAKSHFSSGTLLMNEYANIDLLGISL